MGILATIIFQILIPLAFGFVIARFELIKNWKLWQTIAAALIVGTAYWAILKFILSV